jgi:transposase
LRYTDLRRFGDDISRKTLSASVVRLGGAVHLIIKLLRDLLLDSEIVFGDPMFWVVE